MPSAPPYRPHAQPSRLFNAPTATPQTFLSTLELTTRPGSIPLQYLHSFTFSHGVEGAVQHYQRHHLCWCCSNNLALYPWRDGVTRCSYCGRYRDGAEEVVWNLVFDNRRESNRKYDRNQVDVDEETRYLRESNRVLARKLKVCGVCGKVCRSAGGLGNH